MRAKEGYHAPGEAWGQGRQVSRQQRRPEGSEHSSSTPACVHMRKRAACQPTHLLRKERQPLAAQVRLLRAAQPGLAVHEQLALQQQLR